MSKRITLKLLMTCVGLTLVAACASKKKVDSATADGATPVVSDQAMNFNAQGSDSGQIPGLFTVNFEYDQSRLTSEARRLLAQNAEWIRNNPNSNVQIEGHCDDRGSNEYNLALGERRAQAVRTYLTGLGVEGQRLSVISYGEERPIDNSGTDSAMTKNRRANFVPMAK